MKNKKYNIGPRSFRTDIEKMEELIANALMFEKEFMKNLGIVVSDEEIKKHMRASGELTPFKVVKYFFSPKSKRIARARAVLEIVERRKECPRKTQII